MLLKMMLLATSLPVSMVLLMTLPMMLLSLY
ncbi:hypothetical protein FOTG_18561 [Fusarium oxysporum f. sp. vasinfectum 25433]|uniref:Uncharacterized protein n=1 Tax=Fusarium oxysporum f. sp. vasinfectum 25433 TaxID=1089449 RepID=X0KVZ6_FUSOX|nr:hypothetical protein FOTG_18561 [Fusarium oxysporum f. sp. vasinfectum 25433]